MFLLVSRNGGQMPTEASMVPESQTPKEMTAGGAGVATMEATLTTAGEGGGGGGDRDALQAVMYAVRLVVVAPVATFGGGGGVCKCALNRQTCFVCPLVFDYYKCSIMSTTFETF